MGWANCGTDSKGRPIGYVFTATCEHPGCHTQINRGLAYACGGMHGTYIEHEGDTSQICSQCAKELLDSGEWAEDENEGCLRSVHDDC